MDEELSDWLHAARETLDVNERKELYKKAQQRIIENYNWDKVADEYEELFYELAEGKYPSKN